VEVAAGALRCNRKMNLFVPVTMDQPHGEMSSSIFRLDGIQKLLVGREAQCGQIK
jgi:hypothetical protein